MHQIKEMEVENKEEFSSEFTLYGNPTNSQIIQLENNSVDQEKDLAVSQIRKFISEKNSLKNDQKLFQLLLELNENLECIQDTSQIEDGSIKDIAEVGLKIVNEMKESISALSTTYAAALKRKFKKIEDYYTTYMSEVTLPSFIEEPLEQDGSSFVRTSRQHTFFHHERHPAFLTQSAGVVRGTNANARQEAAHQANQETKGVVATTGIARTTQVQGFEVARGIEENTVQPADYPYQYSPYTAGIKGAEVSQQARHRANQVVERTISYEGDAQVVQIQGFQQGQGYGRK